METTVWMIAGPTASGKSALALRWAEARGAEIVNADSMQIYAGLRLLTARPGEVDLKRAPHHLYGVADPRSGWSAGVWLRAARAVLEAVCARGREAVVVGGTGLYFRALTQGLAEIPEIAPETRAAARALWAETGEASVRERLRALDPESEGRIASGDRQRLIRALEVVVGTGRTLGAFAREGSQGLDARRWRGVVLEPPRDVLYARCDARLAAMAADEVLGEVQGLLDLDLSKDAPVMKALGVREFARCLRGEGDYGAALSAAQGATRRYAKRQTTWFRGQAPEWPRLSDPDPKAAFEDLSGLFSARQKG